MATAGRSTVFRVTGLPTDRTDDQLVARLSSIIHENLQEEERSRINVKIALAPSCQNDDQTSSIALVDFEGGVPRFLSSLNEEPLGDWQMEMGDTDINFDRHFFGFTQIYHRAREGSDCRVSARNSEMK